MRCTGVRSRTADAENCEATRGNQDRAGTNHPVDSGQSPPTPPWLRRSRAAGVLGNFGVVTPKSDQDCVMVRVLCYHSIEREHAGSPLREYAVEPTDFDRQIRWFLRTGYHFVEAEAVLRYLRGIAGLPRRAMLISFDDGYRNFSESALPVLLKYQVPAIIFAVSGLLGGYNDWDSWSGEAPKGLLSAAELGQLRRVGVAIGGHSRTHPVIPELDEAATESETLGSIRDLESLGLNPVPMYAYPFGKTSPTARRLLQENGILGFALKSGLLDSSRDRTALPRTMIRGNRSMLRVHFDVLTMNRRPRSWGKATRLVRTG